MNKTKLIKAINSKESNGFSDAHEALYVNIINVNKPKTNFDKEAYDEIVCYSLYLYHIKNGLHKISEYIEIPKSLKKEITYEQFKKELEKYKDIKCSDYYESLYQEIMDIGNKELLNGKDSYWARIYSTEITKNDINVEGKLYVSIDNSYLYQFAFSLLKSCVENKIDDYEFKINKNINLNRTDNITIFFTKENLNNYISIINKLKQEYPNDAINYTHILAKEISYGVGIAKDFQFKGSFTEKLSSDCLKLKKDGIDAKTIADLIEKEVNEHLESVTSLIFKE